MASMLKEDQEAADPLSYLFNGLGKGGESMTRSTAKTPENWIKAA